LMGSTASGGDQMIEDTTDPNTLQRRGFTLVELLIVVALLATLSMLGIINYSHAQVRAKLARVKADTRTLVIALETYSADYGSYPPAAIGDETLADPLVALTSPRAYVSALPQDPFGRAPFDFAPEVTQLGYNYKDALSTSVGVPGETYARVWQEVPGKKYMLHSCGPNVRWDVTPYREYDPTNGTASNGDLCYFGP
jgi:prepilin-type N-terminal cleavage/methylation domain-containing protein